MVCGSWMNTKHIACDHVKTHWLDVNIIWWLNFFYHLLKLSTYENKTLEFCMSVSCITISCWFVCCFSQFQLRVGRQWQHLVVRRWVCGRSKDEVSGGAGYSCGTQTGHGKQGTKTSQKTRKKNFKLALNVLLTYRQSAFFPPEFVNCFQMNNVQMFC